MTQVNQSLATALLPESFPRHAVALVYSYHSTSSMLTLTNYPFLDGSTLSCQLASGQVLICNGPSGIGKSTLLSHITKGILDPTYGHCSTPTDQIVLVQQQPITIPGLTSHEHIQLTSPTDSEHIDEYERLMAQFFADQPDLLHQHPDQLSGGQRQRVSLLQGFMRPAKLLLLDEPSQQLDRNLISALITELQHQQHLGKALLIVTHDPYLTEAFGSSQ